MSETTPQSGSPTPQFRVDEIAQPFRLGPRPAQSSPEGDLLEQTRQQIRELVDEVASLAKSGCSTATFFEGFLTRTTQALASSGGVIWTRPATDRPWEIAFHINFNQTILADSEAAQAQHSRLLQRVLAAPEPLLVPPDSGGEKASDGNPTSHLLIFAPLRIDQQLIGLVEVFQRPGGGPATQRGYLRFLAQMAELASDFLKSRRLEEFSSQQQQWTELQAFSRLVHATLDPDQVAFTIVNEGRRMIGCDRVALSVSRGQRQQITAVSGLDSIERRASELKRLAELASAVARGRESLWQTASEQPVLPPQIEQPLHAYLDQSQGRAIAILPWMGNSSSTDPTKSPPATDSSPNNPLPPFATLIVEQLTQSEFTTEQRSRISQIHSLAQTALENALEWDRLPLRRTLQTLGTWTNPRSSEPRTRTALGLAAGIGLATLLCLLPWQFKLGAKGKLLPVERHEVYAAVDGTLVEVREPASPETVVPANAILAQMSNHELQLQLERLGGELAKAEVQISNLNHQQLEKSRAQNREQERRDRFYLETELAQTTARRQSIREELEIVQQQVAALTIRSPTAGQLFDWQIRRQLLGRPVNRGDRLMSVVPPDSQFEVELHLAEKKVGHLLAAIRSRDQPLAVCFTLASQPEQPLRGEVYQVDQILAPHDGEGNSLRLLVRFENSPGLTPPLRCGTRVTAQIECGSQPLGYVLFHELIETLRGGWQLWF